MAFSNVTTRMPALFVVRCGKRRSHNVCTLADGASLEMITCTMQNLPRDPVYESTRRGLAFPSKTNLGWANSKTQTLKPQLTILSKGVCGDTRLAIH